jgi:hypothetical protein
MTLVYYRIWSISEFKILCKTETNSWTFWFFVKSTSLRGKQELNYFCSNYVVQNQFHFF